MRVAVVSHLHYTLGLFLDAYQKVQTWDRSDLFGGKRSRTINDFQTLLS